MRRASSSALIHVDSATLGPVFADTADSRGNAYRSVARSSIARVDARLATSTVAQVPSHATRAVDICAILLAPLDGRLLYWAATRASAIADAAAALRVSPGPAIVAHLSDAAPEPLADAH